MPTPVSKRLDGLNDKAAAIRVLQAYLGRPVSVSIGREEVSAEIIKLQKYLQTQGKFSAGNINTSIDNGALAQKIIDLQVAANLP